MNSQKAGDREFTINLITSDNKEEFVVELSNATLTNIGGYQPEDPDLTITIDRSDLEEVMMGAVTFDDQIKSGKAKLKGDLSAYDTLKSLLVQFELGFEMMPGTGEKNIIPEKKPFEQGDIGDSAGG